MHSDKTHFFCYGQCANCSSVSILNIPEDLDVHYDNYNYYSFIKVEKDIPSRRILKSILHKKIPFASSLAPLFLRRSADLAHLALARYKISKKHRILDVGCGSGQLVFELADLGFKNVLGVDPYLKEDMKYSNEATVIKSPLQAIEGNWDFIMLNHVFEHLEDPVNVLNILREKLDPRGKILLRIPNIESYAYRRFQHRWFGIQAPTHIFLPSRMGMEIISNQAAFQVADVFGENVLELWLQSESYELDIWHGHPHRVCSHLKNKKLLFPMPLFCSQQVRYWKHLNKHILKHPDLCDWAGYLLHLK